LRATAYRRARTPPLCHLSIRQREVVHSDETSWPIGGHKAWLWVITQTEITVYVIDVSRGHQGAEQVLGPDFDGVVVCDCLSTDDALGGRQQKCLGHLPHRTSQLHQGKRGRGASFSRAVLQLLRGAIALKNGRRATPAAVTLIRSVRYDEYHLGT
jgi:hypothetical protein